MLYPVTSSGKSEHIFEGVKTESFGRKILALISGYKVKVSKLEKRGLFPLEYVEVNDMGDKKRSRGVSKI